MPWTFLKLFVTGRTSDIGEAYAARLLLDLASLSVGESKSGASHFDIVVTPNFSLKLVFLVIHCDHKIQG